MPVKPGVKLKEASFGSCEYVRTSPAAENFVDSGKAVNVQLTFEEALKLNLAIDEAVRQLNSYKRSTQAGKRRGLNLCLYFNNSRITITETNLPKSVLKK